MSSPYIQTATGKKFYFDGPYEIDIVDIAHGLSHVCRWMGHTRDFYSVAQHSVLLSLMAPTEMKLFALMHDAHEAYMGDLCTPLKKLTGMGVEYARYADKIQRAVEEKYSIRLPSNMDEFHHLDKRMGSTEAVFLMENDFRGDEGWLMDADPFDIIIYPWKANNAKETFLRRFKDLYARQERIQVEDSNVFRASELR